MAKRFGRTKIKLTEQQILKLMAKSSSRSVVAKLPKKKKKKKKKTTRARVGNRKREVVSFGGQAYTYALTSMTDPTSSSWTTKPAGYTYYPGEGIGADAPITDMSSMFKNEDTFNDPGISSWDTSTVTNMYEMFNFAEEFNQPLTTVGNQWNVSNVTDMWEMFNYAHEFNQDLSSWDTGNVTTKIGRASCRERV